MMRVRWASPEIRAHFSAFTDGVLRPTRPETVRPPEPREFFIEVATAPEALAEARRLRYEVFTVEGGDTRYADHALREFRDAHDEPEAGATIIVARCSTNGQVVGTCRLCVWTVVPFVNPEAYPLERLARRWGLGGRNPSAAVCLMDRCVVAKAWRSRGISSAFWHEHARQGHGLGRELSLSFAGVANTASIHGAIGQGYRALLSEQRRGPRLTLLVRDLRCD